MCKVTVLTFVMLLTVLVLGLPNSKSSEGKPSFCHNFGSDVKEGETIPAAIGICAQLTCRNAAKNDVTALTCGFIMPKIGCAFLPEDLTKPYPDCCAHSVCEDD